MILTIALHELKRWFFSPFAWSILAVIQFLLTYSFLSALENFTQIQSQLILMPSAPGVTALVIMPTYQTAAFLFLLLLPILTMRLISEERKQGSLILLVTAPIKLIDLVLGKYVGLMIFCFILLLPLIIMSSSLALGTALDWGRLITAHLGLMLVLSAFAALGLYLSVLVQQPAIAAIASFAALLFLWIIDTVSYQEGNSLSHLSLLSHYENTLTGIIKISDIVYFLLFIITFLLLSSRQLSHERDWH